MPLEVMQPQVNKLHPEKKCLESEIRSLRLDEPPVKIISDEDFQEYADLLKESLQDTETCRNILKTLVKKIRVQSAGDCTLEYHVSAVGSILSCATVLYLLCDNLTEGQPYQRLIIDLISPILRHSHRINCNQHTDNITIMVRMNNRKANGYYNFVLPHGSLPQRLSVSHDSAKVWQQQTPAMAAGITDHLWTMQELLRCSSASLAANHSPEPSRLDAKLPTGSLSADGGSASHKD